MTRDDDPGREPGAAEAFDPRTSQVDDPRRLDYERICIQRAKVDHEAFEYLYEYYYDRIFRFLYNRVLNRVDAQNLTADVFLRALDKLWTFQWQNKPFQVWLYRIALNRLWRHYQLAQRQQARFTSLSILGEDVLADSEQDPAQRLEKIRQRARLDAYLGRLTHEERNWLALRYYESLPVKDIAGMYDVPEGTMKARLSRTLTKMRDMMHDET